MIRDPTWRMIQPGCYVDTEGNAFLFPEEVIAFLQMAYPQVGFDPNSKKDRQMVVETYIDLLRKTHPGIKLETVKLGGN